jgi:hypothetical protein
MSSHHQLPPPHSFRQALERLPLAARRKFERLQEAVADSEALQRSVQQRISLLADKAGDIERRLAYVVRGEDPEATAKLKAELAAVADDLARLERQRSQRNSVRANTDATVSRLTNFVGLLVGGAGTVTWPPRGVRPNGGAHPGEGETLADAILRIRTELATVQREMAAVRALPPAAAEVRAAVKAEVERKAAAGQPRVAFDGAKVSVAWPDVMLYATPGAALSAPSGSASDFVAWLFKDQLLKRFAAHEGELSGGISTTERKARIAELERRAFALELEEESLVEQAIDAGVECHRRPDASPFAVLGIVTPDLPRPAEAAE